MGRDCCVRKGPRKMGNAFRLALAPHCQEDNVTLAVYTTETTCLLKYESENHNLSKVFRKGSINEQEAEFELSERYYSTYDSKFNFIYRSMDRLRSISGFIVVDAICLCIVGIPIIIFHFAVKPFQRGFFCDDDSIRYPYHDSTISSLALYLFGSLANVFMMITIETVIFKKSLKIANAEADGKIRRREAFALFRQLYKVLGVFAFACLTSQMLTDLGKYSIGRLRPHFLDICRPKDFESICKDRNHVYIQNFSCTSTDAFRLKESGLSFPSGHASFSAVTMVYLILYLQARFTWDYAHLLRPVIQVVAYAVAFYTALSRVSDYKHHPTDVIFGNILGTSVAVVIVFTLSGLFKMQKVVDLKHIMDRNEQKNHNFNDCKSNDLHIENIACASPV